MNGISWLIYFAEVLATISGMLFFVVFFSVIGSMIAAAIWGAKTFSEDYYDDDSRSIQAARAAKLSKQFVVAALIACTIDILLPNSRTVYLIAGSELAMQALDTDTAIKVKKVIDIKLDEIIQQNEKTGE